MLNRMGAVWYRGAGDRYTELASTPNTIAMSAPTVESSLPSGLEGVAPLTPLGLPVVPEEYSMSVPETRSGSGSAGCWSTASSYGW